MKFEDMINTIQLGDCYEMIKKIPDNSIDLIIIDPPYLIEQAGGGGCFGDKHRMYHEEYKNLYHKTRTTKDTERLRILQNGQRQKENINFVSNGFDLELLDLLCRIMKKINIYIWCNKNLIIDLLNYFNNKECLFEIITWHKTNPMPTCNNNYCNDTEFCLYFRERGTPIYGSMATKKKYYVSPTNVEDKSLYKHPTIKPINIIKNLITNSSSENDIVLDCFAGSGTTCVAAKELNRRFIGIEINEEYHKIACNRLNGIDSNGQLSIFTDFEQLEMETEDEIRNT